MNAGKNDAGGGGLQAYYGGQAVMEGVMMRGKRICVLAVRTPDKGIAIEKRELKQSAGKIRKLPVIRGVFAFVDSLVLGLKTHMRSAELAGLEDEEIDKKTTDRLLYGSVAFAILLAVGLFMLLPAWIGSFFKNHLGGNTSLLGVVEGFIRIGIFILYVVIIASIGEIKKVFQYHGAEHKTINCYESAGKGGRVDGGELSVPNVKNFSRLHKRCGTSFLFIVMVVSMVVFIFVRTDIVWLRFLSRILLLPFIAGFSYEVIKWAGRREGLLVDIVSFPGMCIQRMTTAEPDDGQIETAIAALRGVLESENESGGGGETPEAS